MKTTIITTGLLFFALYFASSQQLNLEMDTATDSPFLIGKIDKAGLTSEHYNSWFLRNYDDYKVDASIINRLAPVLKDFHITLFMGTWCGDSKQEVPRFYKILEACNFPEDQLTVIALSQKPYMYKQSPNHEESGMNIHRVPTFIFYKHRKEVNRIVEHPLETLEKDMLKIVTSNDYTSNYHIVSKIDSILREDGLNGLKKQHKSLVKRFKSEVSSMFELNTYGRILYSTNRIQEAIEVFKLNTNLFPEEARTYMSLANTLGISGDSKEAIKVLKQAIPLFPENKDLIENLEALKTL